MSVAEHSKAGNSPDGLRHSPVGTVLIVCRDVAHMPLVLKMTPEAGCSYVVASDDPAVQEACRGLEFVKDVCWLEQMESFYGVVDDVLRLLGVVNRWLTGLADERNGIRADLLCWMHHVEGGPTTQRLQDAVLLIRSYATLLERYGVSQILVCAPDGRTFEDVVLLAVARSRGIPVEISGEHRRPADRNLCLSAAYRSCIQARALLALKASEVRRGAPENASVSNGHVVFQLASSADKHIENILPLMQALRTRGLRASALTCFGPQAAAKARDAGLHTEDLSAFLSLKAAIGSVFRVVVTAARALGSKQKFLDDSELSYQGVSLNELLWPSIRDFVAGELFSRCAMAAALEEFFRRRRPRAMKLWGEVALAEGYVAWRAMNNDDRPLLFDYLLGVQLDWPYWRPDTPIDLYLTSGSTQRDALKRRGLPAECIVSTGSLRYDALASLKQTHSPEASRTLLGIPNEFAGYVFWDPSLPIRGFLSQQEQLRVAASLVAITARRRWAVIIKPHPGHRPGVLDRWLAAAAPSNVFCVPQAVLPYHALNAADIVVVKISTIGIEAMLLDTPVASIALDGEERWRAVFEDGVQHVGHVRELEELLATLSDPEQRRAWVHDRLEAQERFLSRYFVSADEPSPVIAARVIANRLDDGQSVAPADASTLRRAV